MIRPALFFCVLQAIDVMTTMHGLTVGAREQNPVGVVLLGGGWLALVTAKALGTMLILLLLWMLGRGDHPSNRDQAMLGLQIACIIMLSVVAWNSWIILLRY